MNARPGRHWSALAALLAAGSIVGWMLPAELLDWQPGLVIDEPWRCWTAAFVHWSELHLGANLMGLAVVTTLGRAAALSGSMAAAWLASWPITHLALVTEHELAHFGGLSGVLHAGVAVAALALMSRHGGRRRLIGVAIAVGLVLKVLLEKPWSEPLRRSEGWDIAVAPLAHASGAIAGAACAAIVLLLARRARR